MSITLGSAGDVGCISLLRDFNSKENNVPMLANTNDSMPLGLVWSSSNHCWFIVANNIYAGSTRTVDIYYAENSVEG